jgi:hypothetical protein
VEGLNIERIYKGRALVTKCDTFDKPALWAAFVNTFSSPDWTWTRASIARSIEETYIIAVTQKRPCDNRPFGTGTIFA